MIRFLARVFSFLTVCSAFACVKPVTQEESSEKGAASGSLLKPSHELSPTQPKPAGATVRASEVRNIKGGGYPPQAIDAANQVPRLPASVTGSDKAYPDTKVLSKGAQPTGVPAPSQARDIKPDISSPHGASAQ